MDVVMKAAGTRPMPEVVQRIRKRFHRDRGSNEETPVNCKIMMPFLM